MDDKVRERDGPRGGGGVRLTHTPLQGVPRSRCNAPTLGGADKVGHPDPDTWGGAESPSWGVRDPSHTAVHHSVRGVGGGKCNWTHTPSRPPHAPPPRPSYYCILC